MIRLLFLLLFFVYGQSFGSQPNIIVILTDDQGWGDIGYNNPKVYTPNMDKLARSGALFTNHYVMAQCTPTRVALMTGRYPSRFGPHATAASTKPAFPKGTPTIASMLKSQGYATCLSGKWHLGSSPDHGPNYFGFDQSYGCLSGAVGNYNHGYRKGPLFHTWHRNHQLIEGSENGVHTTQLITDDAIRFIRQKRDKPFFLYLPFTAVHTPLDERGKFINQPTQLDGHNPNRWKNEDKILWFNDPLGKIQQEQDPEKRLFLAALHHLDHAIGRVIDTLKDQNLYEKTLLLFSSDNGPQVNWPGNAYPDDLKLTNFNQPIPMRGKKIDVYEGGIKVPGFAVWPRKIKPQRIDNPMHIVDWFPTIAQVVGFESTDPLSWDGVDQSPTILSGAKAPDRDFYWVQSNYRRAVRHGDWKVVSYSRQAPAKKDDWNLYNLVSDPLEKKNVANLHPEILADLHQRFLRHHRLDKK
jgi:arylsulfatase A-like enzyme